MRHVAYALLTGIYIYIYYIGSVARLKRHILARAVPKPLQELNSAGTWEPRAKICRFSRDMLDICSL